MEYITKTISSEYDGLLLEALLLVPEGKPKGIIHISHGMSEDKERYLAFMNFLVEYHYICVIHDHRGHGKSVKDRKDLGYFYTDKTDGIIQDLHQITMYIKQEYPNLPVYLFAHSMGTLVARNYMKRYDAEVEKVILCGIPTKNPFTSFALFLSKLSTKLWGGKRRNHLLNFLAFQPYNLGYKIKNSWLCSDENIVKQYNDDPYCGFVFTNNGFLNLFQMLKDAYEKNDWQVHHVSLPILLIGGEDDPVIQNKKKFYETERFLQSLGYVEVKGKLYKGKRHELLNEINKKEVYQDILDFYQSEKEF